MDEQEVYQLLDKDGIADDIHLFNDKLREWEDYYSHPSNLATGYSRCRIDGAQTP